MAAAASPKSKSCEKHPKKEGERGMKRVMSQAVVIVLSSTGSAFAATSGTPLDTVATQVMRIVSGPIALLLIIGGFAGSSIIYFLGRNFEVAFVTLAALAIGGVLCSQIQTMAAFLFPLAGALIG
jgi:hypothetical protein